MPKFVGLKIYKRFNVIKFNAKFLLYFLFEVINAEEEIEAEKKNGKKSDGSDGPPEILEKIEDISKKSYASFLDGIKIFEKIGDKPNVALLYSNCGRLMRFCAFCNSEEGKEVTAEERHYYQKVTNDFFCFYYQKVADNDQFLIAYFNKVRGGRRGLVS